MLIPLPKPLGNARCLSQDQIASAAQGELDDEALEQLNQHLMECDPCRNRFGTMLQSNQSGLFLTEEIPVESISEMVGLELFLQRIGMANWRDLPDLGEQYRIIEKIGQQIIINTQDVNEKIIVQYFDKRTKFLSNSAAQIDIKFNEIVW